MCVGGRKEEGPCLFIGPGGGATVLLVGVDKEGGRKGGRVPSACVCECVCVCR